MSSTAAAVVYRSDELPSRSAHTSAFADQSPTYDAASGQYRAPESPVPRSSTRSSARRVISGRYRSRYRLRLAVVE